jgi:hypothetical protein
LHYIVEKRREKQEGRGPPKSEGVFGGYRTPEREERITK